MSAEVWVLLLWSMVVNAICVCYHDRKVAPPLFPCTVVWLCMQHFWVCRAQPCTGTNLSRWALCWDVLSETLELFQSSHSFWFGKSLTLTEGTILSVSLNMKHITHLFVTYPNHSLWYCMTNAVCFRLLFYCVMCMFMCVHVCSTFWSYHKAFVSAGWKKAIYQNCKPYNIKISRDYSPSKTISTAGQREIWTRITLDFFFFFYTSSWFPVRPLNF